MSEEKEEWTAKSMSKKAAKARKEKLTYQQRRDIAKNAANARWGKKKKDSKEKEK